ncbi:N-((2S)-2-amino-2-carboxyethyl)-L-glutamate dehydrogenase [Actinosynnema sp. ALI-1.44]
MTPKEELLFLDRETVRACVAGVDPVEVVESVLRSHAAGRTTLPAEGYLPWENDQGAYCRSIAMLGAVDGERGPTYGIKLINAAVSNPSIGLDRAGGCGFLFDPRTARPVVLAEAAYLSGLRTAAYTMASLRHLGPAGFDAVSFIGTGAQARVHAELLARYFPAVRDLHVFDTERSRAEAFTGASGHTVHVHDTAEAAVRASHVLVTLTTVDDGYIPHDWFRPGSFVAHVSLDDLLPEVFFKSEALFVDDLELIRENPRRVLGALLADGDVPVTGSLGGVLTGAVAPVRPRDGVVVSNPFGMAVLDVGLLAEVAAHARSAGLGTTLDLLGAAR